MGDIWEFVRDWVIFGVFLFFSGDEHPQEQKKMYNILIQFLLGEYGDYDYDENGAPLPGPAPLPGVGSNLQLTGLLCPTCRQMCQGVDALKDHITKMHGGGGGMNQSGPAQPKVLGKAGGSKAVGGEESVRCNICDKVKLKFQYTEDLNTKHSITGTIQIIDCQLTQ